MEAQAVVDGPQAAVVAQQAVAALAVGVVGQQVEGADRAQGAMAVGVLVEGEVVLREVGGHEALHRPLAQRAVAQDGFGDDAPAEQLGEDPRRHLPAVEPAGEVPQRTLAPARLVHAERPVLALRQLHQEGPVRAPGHPPLELDVALGQQAQRGLCPLVLMHMCPSGSSGRRHNGHGGRPAATRAAACTTNPAT